MRVPKVVIALVVAAAVLVVWQVARDNGVGQTCAVNVFGNKMCGEELRAWCNATDSLRQTADNLGAGDQTAEAERICSSVR